MKRYEKIVGTVTKTIKKLEALTATCSAKAEKITTTIGGLETQKLAEIEEGQMAQVTADKLKKIFE